MINMLQSEFLKYKRTFSKILAFIVPTYILIYSFCMNMYFYQNAMNWWVLAIMPFIIGIICALSSIRELKSGKYRTLKSKDISLKMIWLSKIIVIGCYTFIASLLVIINFLIVNKVFNYNMIDINTLILGVFITWLTTLILIPICLFIAERFGTFATIVVTSIGIVVEVLMTTGEAWYLCPWSISMRLMCPILKTHPNGCLLEVGDPLLNSSVILVGIVVAIIGLVMLSILTSTWFAKKEER